ncbi:NERD domain-containing protein/DEAD/DEAH box helicase [uncultured Tateyamaria sp.]|uniref:nuclease-related domain-containing DEAD/DEAH box helicase n=1 Tax=uncultured Tateyamaria sp. TaxID=455651 RepID=UPI002623FCDE|nr:NERD domain-containing protein/DEAD/DEAH box helicase [uncultured Tateyamaria sp.]
MTVHMIPPICSPNATFTEQQVFNEIRDMKTKEDVYCFQSVGLEKHSTKEHAECDFVLMTPRGVFCLEVKGGAIQRKNGIWTIGSGERSYTTTEGPFKQAEGCRWAVLKFLQNKRVLNQKDALFGWGVILPSVVFDYQDAEWSQDVVYDLRDGKSPFSDYLKRLEVYFERKRKEKGGRTAPPLTSEKLRICADAMRPDFETGLTVLGLVIESQREMPVLSREQFRVLDLVLSPQNPRLICSGGPGTGKTVLALEAARRISEERQNVLYLCFNTELAAHLSAERGDAKFKIATLHKFMHEIIRRAGLSPAVPYGTSKEEHFSKSYPVHFEEACEVLLETGELPQFDALILDEAQDILNERNLTCLSLILSGGMKGRWAIFLDQGDQANVYSRFENSAFDALVDAGAVSVELKENFRNPPKTAAEAYYYSKADAPECRRQLNSPVKFIGVTNDKEAAAKLRALLVELIRDGVRPGDIAILSWRRAGQRLADRFPPEVGKLLVVPREAQPDRQQILSTGIAAFKGLEAEIVIVTDIPDSLDDEWRASLMIVALTRTRTKCYAIVSKHFIHWRTVEMLKSQKSTEGKT